MNIETGGSQNALVIVCITTNIPLNQTNKTVLLHRLDSLLFINECSSSVDVPVLKSITFHQVVDLFYAFSY